MEGAKPASKLRWRTLLLVTIVTGVVGVVAYSSIPDRVGWGVSTVRGGGGVVISRSASARVLDGLTLTVTCKDKALTAFIEGAPSGPLELTVDGRPLVVGPSGPQRTVGTPTELVTAMSAEEPILVKFGVLEEVIPSTGGERGAKLLREDCP